MIVVQARMGSTRLPGKVLRPFAGTTILGLMLDRLRASDLGPVVVATSVLALDDPIADMMASRPEEVFRGPESDVLGRLSDAATSFRDDHIVRLTADCPFVDPDLVASVVATHLRSGADYTSNTLLRTFPDGLDVEVARTDVILEADALAVDPAEREHVTPYLVRRPESYRLAAHIGPLDAEDERWTVDGPDDFAWLARLLSAEPDLGTAGWRAILDRIGFQRPAGNDQVVLRIDRGDRTARPEGATVIGEPAAVVPTSDPARRTWSVRRGSNTLGRLTVDVIGGQGELSGWLAPGTDVGESLDALEHRLIADLQVVELTCRTPDTELQGAFTSRGFTVLGHMTTRRRLPSTLSQTGVTR